MSLKQKTVSGLLWSFIEHFADLGFTFIVGIILARILSPQEFGLIGMIAIFIAVSETFINSGFNSALIRKKDCTQTDYSTVFFYNLTIGILFFALLYISAPAISKFFDEPQLKSMIQVLGVILVIDSLSFIQRTILTKRIDFKLKARISVISSVGSGIIAIIMAYNDFGVWSLVSQRISRHTLNTLFLWLWNRWKPLIVFDIQSFKELFGFGSKLLVSGLIDTIYRNVYYLVIGKYFSAHDLGFYTRAEMFKNLPSYNLMGIINRVSYPVLAEMQDDKIRLRNNYKKLIRSTMFITFILMLGLAAIAEPMIITLIGEKWRPSIIYLQMLSFVGMFYPLNSLNLNMLMVQGRSDLYLKLEIIKKLMAVPVIVIGVVMGIKIMIAGMIFNTLIAYYLNSYWSGRMIGYSFREQVADVLPSFLLAISMASVVFLLGEILPLAPQWLLIIQVTTGIAIVFTFSELTNNQDYMFVRNIVIEKLKLVVLK